MSDEPAKAANGPDSAPSPAGTPLPPAAATVAASSTETSNTLPLRQRFEARVRQIRRRRDWWIDRVYPQLAPEDPVEAEQQAQRERQRLEAQLATIEAAFPHVDPRASEALANLLTTAKALLADEDERRKSVEGRLTSVLGLVTLASSITLAAVGVGASVATTSASHGTAITVVILCVMLYAVVQVVCAGRAAISGLGRRSFAQPAAADVLAAATDDLKRKSLIADYVRCVADADGANNAKVSALAVAHEALKNFLGATIVLMCSALFVSMSGSIDPDDRTLEPQGVPVGSLTAMDAGGLDTGPDIEARRPEGPATSDARDAELDAGSTDLDFGLQQ